MMYVIVIRKRRRQQQQQQRQSSSLSSRRRHNNNNNNGGFLFWKKILLLFCCCCFIKSTTTSAARYPSSSWGILSSSWSSSSSSSNSSSSGDDEDGNETNVITADIETEGQQHETNAKKWSSMLTVDPSTMISLLMIKHGGLILPNPEIKNDIDIIRKVCHTTKVELDIVQKQLIIHNFTVVSSSPSDNNPAMLRIGRLSICWDSYMKPCIDIEIEDVDVFIEFYNILLTQNNWGRLQEQGFPPSFDGGNNNESEESQDDDDDEDDEDFMRIGSITLQGKMTARVTSRPLNNKDIIPSAEIDLHSSLSRKLKSQIKKLSNQNLLRHGRKGCTPNEVYELIQIDFGNKIRDLVKDTIQKFTTTTSSEEEEKGNNDIQKDVHNILTKTKDTITQYVDDASTFWIGEQKQNVNKLLLEKFNNEWGSSTNSRRWNKKSDSAASPKNDEPSSSGNKSIWNNIAKNIHSKISTTSSTRETGATKANKQDDDQRGGN